jgi:hypothetical protein
VYNALTFRVDKRFSGGVSFIGAYTYGHSLDYGMTDEMQADPWNLHLDRGNSTFDVRQRLVMSSVYELPIGRGKRFMTNPARVADALLGGWEVSGITTFQTGLTVSPYTAYAVSMGTWVTIRPDRVGPVNDASLRANIRNHGVVGPYFRIGDLAPQKGNVQGTAARNFIQAPGLNNWDLSFFKNVRLAEHKDLQVRSDFFNTFNHAQFNPPDTTLGDPSLGNILSARDARIIQLSLKLVF